MNARGPLTWEPRKRQRGRTRRAHPPLPPAGVDEERIRHRLAAVAAVAVAAVVAAVAVAEDGRLAKGGLPPSVVAAHVHLLPRAAGSR